MQPYYASFTCLFLGSDPVWFESSDLDPEYIIPDSLPDSYPLDPYHFLVSRVQIIYCLYRIRSGSSICRQKIKKKNVSTYTSVLWLLNTVVLWLLNTVVPVTCYSNYKREALLTLSDFDNADDVIKVQYSRHHTESKRDCGAAMQRKAERRAALRLTGHEPGWYPDLDPYQNITDPEYRLQMYRYSTSTKLW